MYKGGDELMKALPTSGTDLKLFLLSLFIAFILSAGKIMEPQGPLDGGAYLVGWILNILINAIVIMVVIRVIMWLLKKLGVSK